ncbi:MAG: membrane protein insertion efficiency factor YidD [Bifidobacteriaceae bacterium]|nr:membrane protein insertion efficiency factor YidD [Bifidobacteriaceae bacterium]
MSPVGVVSEVVKWPARLVVGLIVAYQRLVSPLTAQRCRFYPSCSSYALVAVRRHGLVKGGALSLARLVRCQPFHPGGVDHVPAVGSWRGQDPQAEAETDEPRQITDGARAPKLRKVTDGLA